jgi:hypothetical protein
MNREVLDRPCILAVIDELGGPLQGFLAGLNSWAPLALTAAWTRNVAPIHSPLVGLTGPGSRVPLANEQHLVWSSVSGSGRMRQSGQVIATTKLLKADEEGRFVGQQPDQMTRLRALFQSRAGPIGLRVAFVGKERARLS